LRTSIVAPLPPPLSSLLVLQPGQVWDLIVVNTGLSLRCEKLHRDISLLAMKEGVMNFCHGEHVTVLGNEKLHSLAWEAAPSH
jgi:hypothetical protein